MTSTREIILPILEDTYGRGSMVSACATHLAEKIDSFNPNDPQWSRGFHHMIMTTCWDWFSGGGTAAACATRIEEALSNTV